MRLSAASGAVALLVAATLALSGCSATDELRVDGVSFESSQNLVCATTSDVDRTMVFGLAISNSGPSTATITAAEILGTNTVAVTEIAVADGGTDGSGWGAVPVGDIPPTLGRSWNARTDAVGATIEAGETRWLLLVLRNQGTPDQTTGARGVRIEVDGASPRVLENEDVYGFVPAGGDCTTEIL